MLQPDEATSAGDVSGLGMGGNKGKVLKTLAVPTRVDDNPALAQQE